MADFKYRTDKIYGSPFNETTYKNNPDGTVTVSTRPMYNGRPMVMPLSTTKFLKACEMAENGETKGDIATTLGFTDAAAFAYALGKDEHMRIKFDMAFERGKEARIREVGRRIVAGRAKSAKKKENMKRNAAIRGMHTAARNKGMTLEEYRHWQGQNMAAARAKKKAKAIQAQYVPKPVQEEKSKPVQVEKVNVSINKDYLRPKACENCPKACEKCPKNAQKCPEACENREKSVRKEYEDGKILEIGLTWICFAIGVVALAFAFTMVWKTVHGYGF